MGMYSFTEYCDLKIRQGKKEEFLKWLKQHEDYLDAVRIDGDNVEINIDGWKIISYWYEEFLNELEELNKFLEGEWSLFYETYEQKAIIKFGEEVVITIGTMEFKDYRIEDLRRENECIG